MNYPKCPNCSTGRMVPMLMTGPACDQACERASAPSLLGFKFPTQADMDKIGAQFGLPPKFLGGTPTLPVPTAPPAWVKATTQPATWAEYYNKWSKLVLISRFRLDWHPDHAGERCEDVLRLHGLKCKVVVQALGTITPPTSLNSYLGATHSLGATYSLGDWVTDSERRLENLLMTFGYAVRATVTVIP